MSRVIRTLCVLALAGVVAGCAAEGGDAGGAENLPDRGIVGWQRVGSDAAPYVLAAPVAGTAWGGPAALVVADRVVVWFHAETADAVDVVRVESEDGVSFGAAALSLADARDPSVARDATGRFLMAYVGPDGLALAQSDDGLAFSPSSASGLPAQAEQPSLAIDGARVIVFAVDDGVIVRSEAGPDLAFAAPVEVLGPGVDCQDPFGEPEPCWDASAVTGPDVRLAETATGRRVWRMFYAGSGGGPADVGFAASFDGLAWTRYAFNPALAGAFPDEAPTSVFFRGSYLLYVAEARGPTTRGIALLRTTPSSPADRW